MKRGDGRCFQFHGMLHMAAMFCVPHIMQKWIPRPQSAERLQDGEDDPVGIRSSHYPNSGQTQPPDKIHLIVESLLDNCKDTGKGTDSNVSPSSWSVLWTSKK